MSDVFDSTSNNSGVSLSVNGSPKGTKTASRNQTIADFVKEQAQYYGVRTFSVFIDGRKLDTAEGSQPMPNGVKLEIVAKDARGLNSGWVN